MPSSPSGFVVSRISVSHSRSARNGLAAGVLAEALVSEPRLANAALHEVDREIGDSPGWRLAGPDAQWEATVRPETFVLQGNAECVPGGALRARFEALSRAFARVLGPETSTRVEARYVYTILLGPSRLAAGGIVREPLLRQSIDASSQRAHADTLAEMRFPLDHALWLTCRHGFSRSTFGYAYLVDSELWRADVTRFEPSALLEALDAMHRDHRLILRACLTEEAVDALFPSPKAC